MARIIASGGRSLRTRPSTRCEMNGSIIATSRRAPRSDTPGAQGPARRMVGSDEHQRAAGTQKRRSPRSTGRRLRHQLRSAGAGFYDLGEPVSEHPWPPGGSRSWPFTLLLFRLLVPAHLVADLAAQPPLHGLRPGLQVAAQRLHPLLDPRLLARVEGAALRLGLHSLYTAP